MKKTKCILLPKVAANLEQLGENIKLARLRRNLSMRLVCERAHISRPTLIKIEKGSPDVSIGLYAAALNALGNRDDELATVLLEDKFGRNIQDMNLLIKKEEEDEGFVPIKLPLFHLRIFSHSFNPTFLTYHR